MFKYSTMITAATNITGLNVYRLTALLSVVIKTFAESHEKHNTPPTGQMTMQSNGTLAKPSSHHTMAIITCFQY